VNAHSDLIVNTFGVFPESAFTINQNLFPRIDYYLFNPLDFLIERGYLLTP